MTILLGLVIACSDGFKERTPENAVVKMALRAPEGYGNKSASQRNDDGIDHLAWEHWGKAAADFRRALEEDPNFAEAHFNLGLSFDQLQEHAVASEHFTKARELAPDDPRITENQVLKNHLP
jgi:Flp pilus assembly protein TadD